MGFLGFGKKDKVVDLGERYRENLKKETKSPAPAKEESGFSFLAGLASSSKQEALNQEQASESQNSEADKGKNLPKLLSNLTRKLEDLSIQLYHLQQRVELLERKTGVKSAM